MQQHQPKFAAKELERRRWSKGPALSSSFHATGGRDPGGSQAGMSERPLTDYRVDVSERAEIRRGGPLPMGTHESGGGVDFALFSRNASRVRRERLARSVDAKPAKVIDLDPARNRTGDVWHVWLEFAAATLRASAILLLRPKPGKRAQP
jgi:hypothetical protein